MFETVPDDRVARWRLLATFVARWGAALSAGDGFDAADLDAAERRLGLALPAALREWYRFAGRREDLWSQQDFFLRPDQLTVEDGLLMIFAEAQSVCSWGIRAEHLALEDPPVVLDREGLFEENTTVSEFALQMAAFTAKFWDGGPPYHANGEANEAIVRILERHYGRFAFPDWHWPLFPTRLYGDADAIFEIDGPADGAPWLWVCARTEAAYRRFERLLDGTEVQWEAAWDEESAP